MNPDPDAPTASPGPRTPRWLAIPLVAYLALFGVVAILTGVMMIVTWSGGS